MNHVRKMFVLLAFLLSLTAGWATVACAEIAFEGGAYAGVYDKYLWRGFDLSGGQPVSQGGLDLSAYGVTLSYWTNVQLSGDKGEELTAGEATETDLIIDYSFDVNDLVWVSVGNYFYMVDGIENTHELYLSAGLNTLLEPSLTVYYDWDEAVEDGLFITASLGHSFDLTDQLSLGLGALVGYNQESDFSVGDYTDWHNAELSVYADYAVTEQISVSPSFLFSTPLSNDAQNIAEIDDEILAGLNVYVSF